MGRAKGVKNPLMSLWLSAANQMAGAANGHMMNEARRQQAALTRQTEKAIGDFWRTAAGIGKKRRKS